MNLSDLSDKSGVELQWCLAVTLMKIRAGEWHLKFVNESFNHLWLLSHIYTTLFSLIFLQLAWTRRVRYLKISIFDSQISPLQSSWWKICMMCWGIFTQWWLVSFFHIQRFTSIIIGSGRSYADIFIIGNFTIYFIPTVGLLFWCNGKSLRDHT